MLDTDPGGGGAGASLALEFTSAEEVLVVKGLQELTAANRHSFLGQVRPELNGHTTVEIDLSRAMLMDCAGLGALVALRNWAHGRRVALRLARPAPPVQELFALVRARALFEVL